MHDGRDAKRDEGEEDDVVERRPREFGADERKEQESDHATPDLRRRAVRLEEGARHDHETAGRDERCDSPPQVAPDEVRASAEARDREEVEDDVRTTVELCARIRRPARLARDPAVEHVGDETERVQGETDGEVAVVQVVRNERTDRQASERENSGNGLTSLGSHWSLFFCSIERIFGERGSCIEQTRIAQNGHFVNGCRE